MVVAHLGEEAPDVPHDAMVGQLLGTPELHEGEKGGNGNGNGLVSMAVLLACNRVDASPAPPRRRTRRR